MDYKFKINDFEGPLDLLLHLIKDSEMDITDIDLVKLTDQYLDFIKNMDDFNLNIASEYLVMASDLMYLKSKSLLPKQEEVDIDEEYIEAKEDLVNRLLEYKKYKEITSSFKILEETRNMFYTKPVSNLKDYKDGSISLSEDVSLDDLIKAFQNYLERIKLTKPINTKVTTKEISISERRKSIRNILKSRKKIEFFELFEEFSKPYVVVTFLSILEMAKAKELVIKQENNFDKIYCEAI